MYAVGCQLDLLWRSFCNLCKYHITTPETNVMLDVNCTSIRKFKKKHFLKIVGERGGQKLQSPLPLVLGIVSSRGCPSSLFQLLWDGLSLYIPARDGPSSLQMKTRAARFLLWVISRLLSIPNLWARLLTPSVEIIPCIIFPPLEIAKVLFVYLTGRCLMQNPEL